jgi:hypothetical protein
MPKRVDQGDAHGCSKAGRCRDDAGFQTAMGKKIRKGNGFFAVAYAR